MKVLVIGGTGTVGRQVVQELAKRNVEISVLSRKLKANGSLPFNATHITGDLLNVDTIRNVFNDMDAVFLLNTVSPTEAHEGLMAVNGARMAGVRRIVYLSVHRLDDAPYLPHFGAKLAVEAAIKVSGIPYTILRPNNFYQNDYWLKEALLQHNVYPQPIGSTGVSRVDVRDVAEAAAITLTNDKHEGKTYNLVGPDLMTGNNTADIWSHALNKTVIYGGDDLDAWEQQSLQYSPEWMVFDFKLMYKFFQEQGFMANKEDIRRQTALLGHMPRKFENFAQETAEMWSREPVAK